MTDPPINMTPTRNGEYTRQFGFRIAILVTAIVVLAVVYGLFTGMIVVPAETQTQVWGGVSVLLTAAFVAGGTWVQARSARIAREDAAIRDELIRKATAQQVEAIRVEAVRQAEISRAHSDQNAAATRDKVADTEQKVSTLIARVEDGLGEKFAQFVKEDAAEVAKALRITEMEAENIALKAKLESLLATPAPALPDIATGALAVKLDAIIAGQTDTAAAVVALQDSTVTANTSAVEANTLSTDANSARRDDPEGAAV